MSKQKTRTNINRVTRHSLYMSFLAKASHYIGQVLLFGIEVDMLVLQ